MLRGGGTPGGRAGGLPGSPSPVQGATKPQGSHRGGDLVARHRVREVERVAVGLAVACKSAGYLQVSALCASQEDRHSFGSRCPTIQFRCSGPGGNRQVVLEGVFVSWGCKAVHHHDLSGLKHQLQIGNLWEIVQIGTPGKPSVLQSMGSQRVGHNLATEHHHKLALAICLYKD